MSKMLFTSESVTEGHPDKVCDRISDAILDEIIKNDPQARVACETFCTTGSITVMGEITTECYVDIPQIARDVVCEIGYNCPEAGFDGNTCAVMTAIDKQSPDIAKSGELDYLRPDGKTQVTVEYDDGKPSRIDAVVVSSQHSADVKLSKLREDILEKVIKPTVPSELFDESTKVYINPTGRFVVGGPQGDTGLTGRKIIVDTYGGFARHGGGAFSGKDPTKVDRSAAYAARYIAKNIVAAGIASKCEVQLAYAIGVAHPVSVMVDTFGTGVCDDEKIAEAVKKVFDLRPAAIIDTLKLRRPIYRELSAYGHMGRTDLDVEWEKTDRTKELKKALGN